MMIGSKNVARVVSIVESSSINFLFVVERTGADGIVRGNEPCFVLNGEGKETL